MKIVVLGAYGYTGKLVCEELVAAGIRFALAGRNEEKLAEWKSEMAIEATIEVIDMLDTVQMAALVENYELFINCIGPFAETSSALLEHLSNTNKVYFDITGETVFVQNSYEKYHEKAVENGATILHSCAFESVLADILGTTIQKGLNKIDTIHSYYLMGKGRPSPGTKLTMKLSVFTDPKFLINGEKVSTVSIAGEKITLEGMEEYVAIPYPLPEICFFEWKTDAKNIASFLLMDTAEAKYLNRSSVDQKTKQEVLDLFDARKPKGPKVAQRQKQRFTLLVKAEDVDGQSKMVQVKGTDMYLLTAKIITYFVKKSIDGKVINGLGVTSPTQFLGEKHDLFDVLGFE